MGLSLDRLHFDAAPPDLDEVRREAARRLGDASGLDGLSVDGQTVEALCLLDPFTRPVVLAILTERGGRRLDGDEVPLPRWAHRPIREMPWRDRWSVRWAWWRAALGHARRVDTIR